MNSRFSHPTRERDRGPEVAVYFSPEKSDVELFDELAEKQAELLNVNSSQLRRFFGEIKDLYRQLNSATPIGTDPEARQRLYSEKIEPRFKMIRSKVFYARRAQGQSQLDPTFAHFLEQGITRVTNVQQFVRYVTHLEAVVGFMYGKEKVKQ